MRRATRQATVRVGGVPPDMSDIDLRELFSRSGTILSLQALRVRVRRRLLGFRRVRPPRKRTGREI